MVRILCIFRSTFLHNTTPVRGFQEVILISFNAFLLCQTHARKYKIRVLKTKSFKEIIIVIKKSSSFILTIYRPLYYRNSCVIKHV